MKKLILFLIVVLCTFIFSCKKEKIELTETVQDQQLHDVTFSVTGFKKQTIPMLMNANKTASISDDSLNTLINHLYLVIYNYNYDIYSDYNTFVFIDSISQTSDNPNFGYINRKLPTGGFHISIIGSQEALSFSDLKSVDTPGYIPFFNYEHKGDLFFMDTIINVSNENINFPLTIKRIVGKLEVKIIDTIPDNVSKIELTVKQEAFSYLLSKRQTPLGYAYQESDLRDYKLEKTVTNANEQPQCIFNTFLLNTSDHLDNNNLPIPITLQLQAYYNDGTPITEKLITGFINKPNQKTIYSGKLFDKVSNSGGGFTIGIDPNWGPNQLINFE